MIRYVDTDPALLAAVDDRSRHRRVTGTRGVPCLVRHDLVFARARVTRESRRRMSSPMRRAGIRGSGRRVGRGDGADRVEAPRPGLAGRVLWFGRAGAAGRASGEVD